MPTFDKGENAQALHVQFMQYLRQRILDQSYLAGTRLPSEVALAKEYRISRGTVRLALDTLEQEELIERTHRRGTFVRQAPPTTRVEESTIQKRIALVYSPSRLSLLTGKSPRMLPEDVNMDLLIGVEQAAKSHNYQLSFAFSESAPQQLAFDIQRLRADNVSGMVIYPPGNTTYNEAIWQLKASGMPLVFVDRYYLDLEADYVGIDNHKGSYRATEHLLILGHRRIGFVYSASEDLRTTSTCGRWEGYCQALQDYGIPYDESLVCPDPNEKNRATDDFDAYTMLLTRPDRPDAIFTSSDDITLKLMQLAQRQGLRVPDDLALVGFDDRPFSANVTPALTTVAQSFVDMGFRAGNLLISRINGSAGPARSIELPTSLVVRDSCGARLRVQKQLHASKDM